jgi:hypothetical protein
MNHYILDGKRPARVDFLHWAIWWKSADRTVNKTTVGEIEVSTVFLGLDHQFGEGPPLLFETMIFGGERDNDQWRYSTWREAEKGHDKVVKELQEAMCHVEQSIS